MSGLRNIPHLEKVEADNLGWTHRKYQQYYKGIRVEGAEFTEHIINGTVRYANGKLLEGLDLPELAPITKKSALKVAKEEIGASIYAWEEIREEDTEEECEEEEGPIMTEPEGELLFAYIHRSGVRPENYALAWRFKILASEPVEAVEIYIDAITGDVIKTRPLAHSNGPAVLANGYGTKTIDTKFKDRCFSHDFHYLRATDETRNIHTRIGTFDDHDTKWRKYDEATDDNDCWGCGGGTSSQVYTTAHWILSESWDYFKNEHNRNGMDNQGTGIRVLANSNFEGARYFPFDIGPWIEFGKDGSADLNVIDVGGHEFAHGVIQNTANLAYEREPGALNESFADIFGFMVERRSFPDNWDWTIGEDAVTLRSFSHPFLFNDPSTYLGFNWKNADAVNCPTPTDVAGGNDNCGIHSNSSVQNHWFYLLSTGGSLNGVTVEPIGIDNAARIAYHSLSYNLQEDSQFADARVGAISSAAVIFGDCSDELIQTTNAWAAVGVGAPFSMSDCLTLSGPEEICSDILPRSWSASTIIGSTLTWGIPPQWNVTISGVDNNTVTLNSINPPPPGVETYNFNLSVSSSSGGMASLLVTVEFDCLHQPFIVQNPNGNINQSRDALTSENTPINNQGAHLFSNVENTLSVYPNPANSRLNIIFPFPLVKNSNVKIFDATGRQVFQENIMSDASKQSIDISTFNNGVYYLMIVSGTFTSTTSFVKI